MPDYPVLDEYDLAHSRRDEMQEVDGARFGAHQKHR